jgi:hypothetical protein
MITAQSIVDLLNSMYANDPVATHALCINRVPCSQTLADHPTVIVDELGFKTGRWVVGLLGVLNGLLADDPDKVAMMFEDNGPGSRHLTGFLLVPNDLDRSKES